MEKTSLKNTAPHIRVDVIGRVPDQAEVVGGQDDCRGDDGLHDNANKHHAVNDGFVFGAGRVLQDGLVSRLHGQCLRGGGENNGKHRAEISAPKKKKKKKKNEKPNKPQQANKQN